MEIIPQTKPTSANDRCSIKDMVYHMNQDSCILHGRTSFRDYDSVPRNMVDPIQCKFLRNLSYSTIELQDVKPLTLSSISLHQLITNDVMALHSSVTVLKCHSGYK